VTQHAVDLLAEHELIEAWPLNIQNAEGESQPVSGLFRIKEAALKGVTADALKTLQEGNALSLAYAQLFSQHRLKSFSRLYDLRKKLLESKKNKPNGKPEEISIDEIFGETNDDLIRFNS